TVPDESAAQEILHLKQTLEATEQKLKDAESAPPPGTEGLAQGEETISLNFSFETRTQSEAHQRYSFTWNQLLAFLGPVLLNGATEDALRDVLQESARNQV